MKFLAPILEYRLQTKEEEQYVPIYHYPEIEMEQILARRECEFFVKNGITYKQLSSAIEGSVFVIYLEIFEEGTIENEETSQAEIKLEIRELNALKGHPLLSSEYLSNHLDVLSMIGNVYIYDEHGMEWSRDSAEIDEDRKVYVFYVTPTGYTIST